MAVQQPQVAHHCSGERASTASTVLADEIGDDNLRFRVTLLAQTLSSYSDCCCTLKCESRSHCRTVLSLGWSESGKPCRAWAS